MDDECLLLAGEQAYNSHDGAKVGEWVVDCGTESRSKFKRYGHALARWTTCRQPLRKERRCCALQNNGDQARNSFAKKVSGRITGCLYDGVSGESRDGRDTSQTRFSL